MKKSISHIIPLLLIILWVYAAVSKLVDYELFLDQLKRQPLPAWAPGLLSWALPATEITTAVLLCVENTLNYGMVASCIMLACFTIYTGLALSGAYGSIPCSCGGIFSFMQWKGHLIFNAAATTAVLAGWKMGGKEMDITVMNKRRYYAHNGKEAENP
jgi:putative oxidoreductase